MIFNLSVFLIFLAKKDTPKVAFSESTPTKVGFVDNKSNSKVGFADDVDYKKRYEEISKELNELKANHEKEVFFSQPSIIFYFFLCLANSLGFRIKGANKTIGKRRR